MNVDEKDRRLRAALASFDSVVVAFSGGVDSAYVAWSATQVLGTRALCVTADSPSFSDHHRQLARRIAREHGLRHEIIHTAELERPEYRSNPVNRCYFCKQELYTALSRLATDRGIAGIVDGSSADDRGDYRPGREAAHELGVRSPLDESDLVKKEIRELSRRAGLPTWNEPASACLSSRIPYHSSVTDRKLRMIERGEDALRAMGFAVCRVRHHESQEGSFPKMPVLARVELAQPDIARALEPACFGRILAELRAIGYADVVIDPRGYRMGSLNEGILLTQTPAAH